MAQTETADRVHVDAGGDRPAEDPISQAGQAYLAELKSELSRLEEEREAIKTGRSEGFGIVNHWKTGFRRTDLNDANERVRDMKLGVEFLTELVDGGYRFTKEPTYAYAGHTSDPSVYTVKGMTSTGVAEALYASTTFRPGEGQRDTGRRVINFSQRLGEGELQTGPAVTDRVVNVAKVLHKIYGRAGKPLRAIK